MHSRFAATTSLYHNVDAYVVFKAPMSNPELKAIKLEFVACICPASIYQYTPVTVPYSSVKTVALNHR